MKSQFDIVIFGGAGDLALRKLLPAWYRSFCDGKLTGSSRVIVTCRNTKVQSQYLEKVAVALQERLEPDEFSETKWQQFQQFLHTVVLDLTDISSWQLLQLLLNEDKRKVRVYYLAIPPSLFSDCCRHLSECQLITERSRVVVEKPIGYDAASADTINTEIASYFPEQDIYRIDHYLGKETVQNLMALRFTNLIFEQLWDAKSIDHVQISISETVGLEGRAGFYNEAGALRDMVQNHLLQLLCLVAMESPNKINAKSIQAEKIKVLEALRPMSEQEVRANTVRGQYVAGNYSGELVLGYLEELKATESNTETFVAIRTYIDNWRWARVPFYLRTGKRMKSRCAEIVVQFKDVSHRVYSPDAGALEANRLVIRLQPEELIQLSMMSKNLDTTEMQLQPTSLNLNFSDTYKKFHSDSYKRLMLDVIEGESSLFIHRDEVKHAWSWIDPIIAAWQKDETSPHLYRAGSWGPDESDALIQQDGRSWYNSGATDEAVDSA